MTDPGLEPILDKLKDPKVFAAILTVVGFLYWAFTGQDIDPEVLERAESTYNAVTAISE